MDLTDAMEMARDAIGLKGIDLEDDEKEIPTASDYDNAFRMARENSDIFDYSQGILTMVDVNFFDYRRKRDMKMVRRNVTLPNWLNREAERLQLNVSKILQDALSEYVMKLKIK